MKLIINDNITLKSLQDTFTKKFPFLKIEFFSKKHKKGEGSSKTLLRKETEKVGDCRRNGANGTIVISGKEKVSEIEQLFQETYGLSVQIFRKSGRVWLETTSTDDWTLEKQNAEAEELSLPAKD
jgi:hypothetical protein